MQTQNEQLFIEAWKLMTGRLPSPQFSDAGGLTSCFADVPNLFFNLWIQSQPAATPEAFDALLRAASDRAATTHNTVGGIVSDALSPAGWEGQIAKAGLAPMVPMTGMEADELLPPRRPPPALEIRRVTDDAGARDLALLNADAYGMPHDLFDCISNMRLWQNGSLAFVGYADGAPVASSAALPVMNTVYIALVATAPNAQRRGYAETVMRHTITEAQKAMGVTRTTLHATEAGKPVYAAMGYKSGGRLTLVGPAH